MATIKFTNLDSIGIAIGIAGFRLEKEENLLCEKRNNSKKYINILGYKILLTSYDSFDFLGLQLRIGSIKDDINSLQTLYNMLELTQEIELTDKEFNLIRYYTND